MPVPLGILLGLFLGKQVGVFLFSYISIKLGFAKMPNNSNWINLYGVGILTGIGFTMSLFVGNLAFVENTQYIDGVKIGVNLEDVIDLDRDINFDAFLENVEKNNYSLALLNNDLLNSTILLAKEKLNNKPSLDLSTSVEYSDSGRIDSGTEKTNGTIGLTLTIPIFQQNNDKSDIRKYQSQLLQAELTLDDAKQDLSIQASNLYKNYLISKSNITSNNKQIESIQTSLKSIQEEYNIGTKTINELIDAESELLNVKVNLNTSKKDMILNYFNIMALEGSLISSFEKYLPEYN